MRVFNPMPCNACKHHRKAERIGTDMYTQEHCAIMKEKKAVVVQNGGCLSYEGLSSDDLRLELRDAARELWLLYVDSNSLIDREQMQRETQIRDRLRDLGVGI